VIRYRGVAESAGGQAEGGPRRNVPKPAFQLHCYLTAMDGQLLSQLERCIESLHHLCESLPECDAVGKLRGKLGRLRSAMDDYKQDGDAGPFRQELSAAHAIVQRFHDADPLNRMLETVSELRRTIDNQTRR
jgi:hypothetical protein